MYSNILKNIKPQTGTANIFRVIPQKALNLLICEKQNLLASSKSIVFEN